MSTNGPGNTVHGSYVYRVQCPLCGFVRLNIDLRKRWDGLYCCADTCWEPRNILDFYRTQNDTHELPFTYADDLEAGVSFNVGTSLTTGIDDSGSANFVVAQDIQLPACTTQSLSFYVTTPVGNIRLGLYDSTGPGGSAGTKLVETAELVAVAGWNTGVTPQIVIPAGTYYLAFILSSNSLHDITNATGIISYKAQAYGPLPTTFPTSGLSSQLICYSMYGTFTSANPYYGIMNIEVSTDNNNAGFQVVGPKVTFPTALVVSGAKMYVDTPVGNIRMGIYDAKGGGGRAGSILAQSDSQACTAGWNTVLFSNQVVCPAGDYYLAWQVSADACILRKSGGVGVLGGIVEHSGVPFQAFPNTWYTSGNNTDTVHSWSSFLLANNT